MVEILKTDYFYKLEHFPMPTKIIKQNKNNWVPKTCSNFIISWNSHINYSLTCPKTWVKGTKQLKMLEIQQFFKFEHSSLPVLIPKQNKNNYACNYKTQSTENFIILCNFNVIHSMTWRKGIKRPKILKFYHSS